MIIYCRTLLILYIVICKYFSNDPFLSQQSQTYIGLLSFKKGIYSAILRILQKNVVMGILTVQNTPTIPSPCYTKIFGHIVLLLRMLKGKSKCSFHVTITIFKDRKKNHKTN